MIIIDISIAKFIATYKAIIAIFITKLMIK